MKFIISLCLFSTLLMQASAQTWQEKVIQHSCTGLDCHTGQGIIDYDGDGLKDIIYGMQQHDELFLVHNNEYGQPQLELLTDTLYGIAFIKVADVNNDGLDDFIVNAETLEGGKLLLYTNDGSYNYTPSAIGYFGFDDVQRIEVADFDQDADMDILVDDWSNSNIYHLFENVDNTAFNFSMISFTGQPTVIYGVDDFDNDGLPDIAGAYFNFGLGLFQVVVLENNGDLTFTIHNVTTTSGGGKGIVGDYKGNDLPDLIIGNASGTGNSFMVENIGEFAFNTPSSLSYSTYARFIGPFDYDNNGQDDYLVSSASGETTITLVLQQTNGNYIIDEFGNTFSGYASGFEDLDNDGDYDLHMNAAGMLVNDGTNNFSLLYDINTITPYNLTVADMDGNGKQDFAGTLYNEFNRTDTWFNEMTLPTEHAPFTGPFDITSGFYDMKSFDKDNDGDIDLLIIGEDYVMWMVNNNGMFAQSNVNTSTMGLQVWVGYLDDDLNIDILIPDTDIKRFEANGANWTSTTISAGDVYYNFAVVDVDNDGDNDIPYIAYNDVAELRFLKNTNNTFADQMIMSLEGIVPYSYFEFNNKRYLETHDLDDDGDDDLVLSSFMSDLFVWLRNDGNSVYVPLTISSLLDGPQGFAVYDFDMDSDNDIAIIHQEERQVQLMVNDGDENFVATVIAEDIQYPTELHLADRENDGDMDIAYSSVAHYKIAWLNNPLYDCPATYAYETTTICSSDSVLFDGQYISEEGMYFQELANTLGCDSVFGFQLFNHEMNIPVVTNNANDVSATPGFVSYAWFLDDVLLSDETDNTLNAADHGTGDYVVWVIDVNGCITPSDEHFVQVIGVEEISDFNFMHAFPNPTEGRLQIQRYGNIGTALLSIHDIQGRLVDSIVMKSAMVDYDTSSLNAGMYVVSCETSNGIERITFIKL